MDEGGGGGGGQWKWRAGKKSVETGLIRKYIYPHFCSSNPVGSSFFYLYFILKTVTNINNSDSLLCTITITVWRSWVDSMLNGLRM
jgi:hypothetical protein